MLQPTEPRRQGYLLYSLSILIPFFCSFYIKEFYFGRTCNDVFPSIVVVRVREETCQMPGFSVHGAQQCGGLLDGPWAWRHVEVDLGLTHLSAALAGYTPWDIYPFGFQAMRSQRSGQNVSWRTSSPNLQQGWQGSRRVSVLLGLVFRTWSYISYTRITLTYDN